jgi:hypothetical protein
VAGGTSARCDFAIGFRAFFLLSHKQSFLGQPTRRRKPRNIERNAPPVSSVAIGLFKATIGFSIGLDADIFKRSANLATLVATRRASSRVRSLPAARRPGSSSK